MKIEKLIISIFAVSNIVLASDDSSLFSDSANTSLSVTPGLIEALGGDPRDDLSEDSTRLAIKIHILSKKTASKLQKGDELFGESETLRKQTLQQNSTLQEQVEATAKDNGKLAKKAAMLKKSTQEAAKAIEDTYGGISRHNKSLLQSVQSTRKKPNLSMSAKANS